MNKNRKKKWIVTGSILLVFCGGLWLYNRYGKTDGPIAPTEAPLQRDRKRSSTSMASSCGRRPSPTPSRSSATCCLTRR